MDSNKKIYVIIGVLSLAIIGIGAGVIFPLLWQIKITSESIVATKSETVALQLQNTQIEDFKKKYDEYKPNLEALNALFIDPQNPVDFIKFLESAARDAGITLQISLIKNDDQQNASTVTFDVSTHADFLKIEDFTQSIEHGPYLVEIKNLTITNPNQPGVKNTAQSDVNAAFKINAFTKP